MNATTPPARTALMRLLNQVEPDYLAHHFGDAYEIDTIADTLLVVHRAQVRPEVLNEAADLIEAEQHCLDDAENAKHGYLDHETELQHTAVHAMGALLRRVAAGQSASGSKPLCNATNGTTICQRHPHTDDQHISPDGPNPTTASVWRDGSRSPAPMTVPWGPGWAALVADTAPNGETTQPADFFQPGHGYTHRSYGNDFHCVTVTTHPTTGERLAMGWLSEHGEWHRPTVVGINQWNHEYDGAEPPDDHGSIEDAHSATELYEMDRDAEFRHDAEDDARNTAEVEAEERGEGR